MIYVSTSCIKADYINDSVRRLAGQGFRNIELSGGTGHYDSILEDLLNLKGEYSLNYLCHNYFPPPREDFVLNLGSLDRSIAERSVNHIETAIEFSGKLGAEKFGFHAGFLMDIPVSEIGAGIRAVSLNDRDRVIEAFCRNFALLNEGSGSVDLYIENNVISSENFANFNGANPLLLTDITGYEELKQFIDYRLLLDVGHLKVSAETLGLDFRRQLQYCIEKTDYIHLSDNDGKRDSNNEISKESDLFTLLSDHDFTGKTVTLEVYRGMEALSRSYEAVETLF